MAGQTIQVSVLADTRKFSAAMRDLGNETGFSKVAARAKKMGKAIGIAGLALAGLAAVGIKKAVDAASSLQQSMGGVDAVFKGSAKQVHKWAKSAAKDMGLSKTAYNEAATIIGTTLKNAGIPMDALGGKTNKLLGLSSDLAATFGGTVPEASAAMASALRGEFEPLRKFGISLSQADISTKALAMSGKANAKQLTKQEKAIAAQALMYEQSTDAQGAFARESNTLAGQQERLKARFENVTATVGTYLLPVMTTLTKFVGDRLEPALESLTGWVKQEVIPRLQQFGDWFKKEGLPRLKQFGDWLKTNVLPLIEQLGNFVKNNLLPALINMGKWIIKNKDVLLTLAIVVGTAVAAWQGYLKVMAIWKAVTTAAKAAQIAFNVVMAANPIALIVIAIAALVAGLVFLFTKTETGKKLWASFTGALQAGWDAIKSAFSAGYDTVKSWLQKAWDFIKKVWSYSPLALIIANWDKIKEKFKSGYDTVKSWLQKAWDFIKKVWSYSPLALIIANWDKITGTFSKAYRTIKGWLQKGLDFIKELPRKIGGFLSGIGGKIASKFVTMKDKIKGYVNDVLGWFRDIPGKIGGFMSKVGSKITAPFKAAFNAVARFWNKSVGRVNFNVPNWVPGVGGKSFGIPNIPLLAQGGIVSRATLAMIGEGNEPEAVLPLSKLKSLLGGGIGGGATYHINVVAGVGDPIEIGRQVKDVLQAYERVNGGR